MTNTVYVLQTRYLGTAEWTNAVFVGKDVHDAENKALDALRAEIRETIADDEEYGTPGQWSDEAKRTLETLTTLYELIEWVKEQMDEALTRCGWEVPFTA